MGSMDRRPTPRTPSAEPASEAVSRHRKVQPSGPVPRSGRVDARRGGTSKSPSAATSAPRPPAAAPRARAGARSRERGRPSVALEPRDRVARRVVSRVAVAVEPRREQHRGLVVAGRAPRPPRAAPRGPRVHWTRSSVQTAAASRAESVQPPRLSGSISIASRKSGRRARAPGRGEPVASLPLWCGVSTEPRDRSRARRRPASTASVPALASTAERRIAVNQFGEERDPEEPTHQGHLCQSPVRKKTATKKIRKRSTGAGG